MNEPKSNLFIEWELLRMTTQLRNHGKKTESYLSDDYEPRW